MLTKRSESDAFQAYLFHQGTNFASYEYLGAHETFNKTSGEYECTFKVWAPNAIDVTLASDFTGWNTPKMMERETEAGVWSVTLASENSFQGMKYKYAVTGRDGITHMKADPYATSSETLKNTASIVCDISTFKWNDRKWLNRRRGRPERDWKKGHFYPEPMNIYEVHLASWKTENGESTEEGENYISYRRAADELAPYLTEMGYTHIELLPIMEHPFDGSWGYQVTGYYAPSARFGEPADFAYFVNKMHESGIGVILDWVPAHFPKDRAGLFEFDGQPLYEYQGADRMEHKGWGTRCFDVARNEVQSFLISNALFWMRKYHVDGLRIDAVASMLYLDYDRDPGEWIPNSEGGNHNFEAMAFFRKLNSAVFGEFPDMLMIAEESTSWPMITKPAYEGGLGFNFKWNMGWANDMFEYVELDPIYRQYNHSKLTFPLMYAFGENYVLPVSHDEVVHGKKSLIHKMHGEYDTKFAGMRAFLVNMMTLPGKKLTFMGTEFAQWREWDFANQLEWFMLEYPRHTEMQRFVKKLNRVYVDSPELWEIDDGWDGFRWIYANSDDMNMVAYARRSTSGSEILSVVNYSPVTRGNFIIEVDEAGVYDVIVNSDKPEFGGKNIMPYEYITSEVREEDGRNVLRFDLPEMSGVMLKKRVKKRGRPKKSEADGADEQVKKAPAKKAPAKKTGTAKADAAPKKSGGRRKKTEA
ncbi:MAG: 1,4-alpha-glucan branching protein GlgB [Clostridia bacterium]|nr:1,4-alpha-glucan branching protein GlgB [Clostridia bacterium]